MPNNLFKTERLESASRRQVLAAMTAVAALSRVEAQAQDAITIPGKRSMILHNDRPEDLETPLQYFDQWLTPNDVFFVRQHLPRPVVQEADFKLSVAGRVSHELQLTVADLRKLPQYTVPAVLECTGNGRGFFQPRVPGIQ